MSNEINTKDVISSRVIKTSVVRLVTDNRYKPCVIKAIDKLVLLNSKIAVRGSMIMNYLVVKCVEDGTNLPPIDQGLLYKAFNWNHLTALSHQHPEIENLIPDPIGNHDEHMDGKGWLIDYLVIQYTANIKTSIRGKYNSVIKQSIKGHIKAHVPNASKDDVLSLTSNLKRCIHHPRSETAVEYSHLDENARGLVKFHRVGFGVDDEGYINDYFIDGVLRGHESISRVVMHFAMCLQRQELLQDTFLDGANVLKKQTALPMFHMGERKSIYICKDGMRWLLKQIKKEIVADDEGWEDVDDDVLLEDVGEVDEIEDNFRKQVMNFRGNKDMDIFTYKKWLIRLFDIGKNGNFKGFPNPVTSGKQYDHWGGVKVVTDGVTASVFYVNGLLWQQRYGCFHLQEMANQAI